MCVCERETQAKSSSWSDRAILEWRNVYDVRAALACGLSALVRRTLNPSSQKTPHRR